jgi:hypothetical protein
MKVRLHYYSSFASGSPFVTPVNLCSCCCYCSSKTVTILLVEIVPYFIKGSFQINWASYTVRIDETWSSAGGCFCPGSVSSDNCFAGSVICNFYACYHLYFLCYSYGNYSYCWTCSVYCSAYSYWIYLASLFFSPCVISLLSGLVLYLQRILSTVFWRFPCIYQHVAKHI